jgi:hypothetical protein
MQFNFLQKLRNRHIVQSNMQRGVMAVEIQNSIGIGARMEWVLEILAFCDENNLSPRFRFSYPGSDTDYFAPFFKINQPDNSGEGTLPFAKIFTISDLKLGKNYDQTLTLKQASELIQKYLSVQDDIQEEVDIFCNEHFQGRRILGVHYRGTDKHTEAGAVTHENVADNIRYYLQQHPDIAAVFVSTDAEEFLKEIEKSSIEKPILYRADSFRSTSEVAIHFSGQNKYDINRDALVNCLLLSRCDALIKSASILSAWSVLFNPEISLVMLNTPYEEYFPERELLKIVEYEAI